MMLVIDRLFENDIQIYFSIAEFFSHIVNIFRQLFIGVLEQLGPVYHYFSLFYEGCKEMIEKFVLFLMFSNFLV